MFVYLDVEIIPALKQQRAAKHLQDPEGAVLGPLEPFLPLTDAPCSWKLEKKPSDGNLLLTLSHLGCHAHSQPTSGKAMPIPPPNQSGATPISSLQLEGSHAHFLPSQHKHLNPLNHFIEEATHVHWLIRFRGFFTSGLTCNVPHSKKLLQFDPEVANRGLKASLAR